MANKHQIIIIQKGETLPDGLRQSLQTKGYGTRVLTSDAEAIAAVGNEGESLVVVYCSSETDIPGAMGSLAELKPLHPFPLIIVGSKVDQYESFLNRHFLLATTITTPCTNNDIISAVEYVIRYVEKLNREPKKVSEEIAPSEVQAVHNLYKQFPTIPNLVFDQIVKLGILAKDIGGSDYATNFRPDKLEEKPFLPKSPDVRSSIEDIADSVTEHKLARYFRIGFLSDVLFRAVGISGETLEDARSAAFLYNSSFIVENRDLVMKEYLSDAQQALRHELCSRIKDSALYISTDFGLAEVGRIIALVGRFIGEEEVPTESTENLAASCIATADLVDRIVYIQGVFNPVAAYCLLARLKSTPLTQIHPLILGCLVKILAEAVTSDASGIAKNKKLRSMGTFINAAVHIQDIVLSKDESSIELSKLSPGMKLSRPLTTFDGKQVLNQELILDQDLIWRLWQLAAIRPIGGSVTVFTDSEVH